MKRTPILLADGTLISVQASSTHYCSPKSDGAFAYSAVEVLIDIPNDPEHYNKVDKNEGWVNGERVLALIAEHGGIIGGQLPPLDFGNKFLVEARALEVARATDDYHWAQKAKKKGDEEE